MADPSPFSKLVPGFDFLQGLVKNAGAALPAIGQWVAPTLDPDALQKRIDELRTVQFWLEQNVTMLSTTIQALEVQRMTLATLKTMNVQMDDLRDSLTIRRPGDGGADAAPARNPQATAPPRAASADAAPAAPATTDTAAATTEQPKAAMIDPMQWWGALAQQFTQLAATAMQDGAADATGNLAAGIAKPSADAANDTPPPGAQRAAAREGAARAPAATTRSKAGTPRKRPAPAR